MFVILGSLEEMQSKPVVFFIFYFWSIIELFRLVGFFPPTRCAQNKVVVPKNSVKKILIFVFFGRVAPVHWPQRVKDP